MVTESLHSDTSQIKLRVAFVHPDLGIGGAERLIVDLAYGLHLKGHDIHVFTSHYDPTHCFDETKSLSISTFGDFLPRGIFGLGYLFFAFLRGIYLSIRLIFLSKNFDIIVVDQLSLTIPLLRFKKSKIVFYCHFPDQLLAKRGGFLKQLYRKVFDALEEYTIRMSDQVLVNSEFTLETFRNTFKTIKNNPDILYPAIKVENYNQSLFKENEKTYNSFFGNSFKYFLSINRFEIKKGIDLGLRSYMKFKKAERIDNSYKLIISGGYDIRVQENTDYLISLQNMCKEFKLKYITIANEKDFKTNSVSSDIDVIFILNFNTSLRNYLLYNSIALLYTPINEHFGIVPIEAMYCKLPVIATNTGGPKESVINNVTGYLIEPNENDFSNAMLNIIDKKELFGSSGKLRVEQKFTANQQLIRFNEILVTTLGLVQYDALTYWVLFIITSISLPLFSIFWVFYILNYDAN